MFFSYVTNRMEIYCLFNFQLNYSRAVIELIVELIGELFHRRNIVLQLPEVL